MESKILNYKIVKFFLLKKKWSGGRSNGKKIFQGQVGSCLKTPKKFIFLDRYQSILNSPFTSQFLRNPFILTTSVTTIFFFKLGIFMNVISTENISKKIFFKKTQYINSFSTKPFLGNGYFLNNLPVGSLIYELSMNTSEETKISRSAGSYSKILKKNPTRIFVQLPSKIIYSLPSFSFCKLGIPSQKTFLPKKKAGLSRLQGKIPKVRGYAQNPVDHPNGGRTKGGRPPKNKYGYLEKFKKTRTKKKTDKFIFSSLKYSSSLAFR